MIRLSDPRKLFAFDFICAFTGAAFYFLLFEFVIEYLGLPTLHVKSW